MIDERYYAKVIAKNLRNIAYSSQKSQTDISKDLHISQATISSWMNGTRIPRMDKIDLLCHYFNVSRADIMEEHSDEEPKNENVIKVPIYGLVAAGIPMEMIEDIMDEEEIPKIMGRGGKRYFGLRIKGDSMEPRMRDGDNVIALKQPTAETGDVVIATVNGDDAVCKRYRAYDDGSVALVSDNPAYPPMVFTAKEVKELPVRVLGKVVELRGKNI